MQIARSLLLLHPFLRNCGTVCCSEVLLAATLPVALLGQG